MKDFELVNKSNELNTQSRETEVNLITYDYVVRHQSWLIEPGKHSSLDFLKQIAKAKTPFQRFGHAIDGNREWEQAGLPKPSKLDYLTGSQDPKTPSNLYSGTELYGALEGLHYLLEQQQEDARGNSLTQISLAMDGLTQRRPWWDADPSQPIDLISGVAIQLPKTLGGNSINHSGLSSQNDGKFKSFIDSNGHAPWKHTMTEIRNTLQELSAPQGNNIITRFIGQSVHEPPMTKTLVEEHLFAPTNDEWNHKIKIYPCAESFCPSTLA